MFNAPKNPARSKYLADGVLLLLMVIVGSMLIPTPFFRDYVAQGQTADIIGAIGLIGTAVYFGVVALTNERWVERKRFVVVLATVLIIITVLVIQSIKDRRNSPHQVGVVSDSMVQIESAANLLLHGQNPYTADFSNTANGWRFDPNKDGHYDPARDHYIYPPLSTMLILPVVWLGNVTHTTIDGRWVPILALLSLWWLLVRAQKGQAAKTRVTIVTLGNPALYLLAVAGFNDMIVVLALVAAAWFGKKQKWIWSAVCLAVAAGTKQTSWLFVVLWFAWLWWSAISRRQKISASLMALVIMLAVYVPFIAWNPGAFFEDTVWYMALALPAIHAITGPTIVPLLTPYTKHLPGLLTGVQALLGLAGLSFAGLAIRRRPDATWWLIGGAMATLLLAISHQFFYYNYAIGILGAVIGGYALSLEHESPK